MIPFIVFTSNIKKILMLKLHLSRTHIPRYFASQLPDQHPRAMKSAKGSSNFRNLFMYSPNGKKDGIKIIRLPEVIAKDEFLNIKNVM